MEGATLQFCRNLRLLGSISVIGIHQQRLVAVVVQHHAAAVNIHQMDPAAAFVIRDNINRYLDLIGRRPRGNYLAARYQTAVAEPSPVSPSSAQSSLEAGQSASSSLDATSSVRGAEFVDISDTD